MSAQPSTDRQEELVAIIQRELDTGGGSLELNAYHDWDGLIECDEEMTFEEWTWLHENYRIEARVVAKDAAGGRPELDAGGTEGWVPVGERLPEPGVPVLAYWKRPGGEGAIVAVRENPPGGWFWNVPVTHWRPLPAPPEEE